MEVVPDKWSQYVVCAKKLSKCQTLSVENKKKLITR